MLPGKAQGMLLIFTDEMSISCYGTLSMTQGHHTCGRGVGEHFYLVLEILASVKEKGKHTSWGLERCHVSFTSILNFSH